MVNFPTRIPDCDSYSPALLDFFLSSDAGICSAMGFSPLENCCCCLSLNHLRDLPWEDTFKIGVSAAASEFCEWVQVEIDAYIPHRKY